MKKIDIAKKYTEQGIKVFPCCPDTKKPYTKNGFKAASDKAEKIDQWFIKWPDALIGAACDDQFTVIDCDFKKPKSFESLGKIHSFVTQTDQRVTTKNDGFHYYFQADESVRRQINFIPDIDVLGYGGYVILPDGKDYVQQGDIEDFVNGLSDLPKLDQTLCDHLTGEQEIEVLSEYRQANKTKKATSGEPDAKKSDDETSEEKAVREQKKAFDAKIYQRSQDYTSGKIEFDGTPIKLEPSSVTKEVTNALFYNKEIQAHLAHHLYLKLPSGNDETSSSFRSLLPGHDDHNPSMGTRWATSSKMSHLIVRDFSDHFNDQKTDYNLVRLYACMQKKKKVGKLSAPEFYVWFMKLLHESGVIEVEVPTYKSNTDALTKLESKVADGFLKLMAYKRLYKDGNDETVFANRFAADWCGVSTPVVNGAKQKLIAFGCIEKNGQHGEGMMATPLFKLGQGTIRKEEVRKKDVQHAMKETVLRNRKNPEKRFIGQKTKKAKSDQDDAAVERVNKDHIKEPVEAPHKSERRQIYDRQTPKIQLPSRVALCNGHRPTAKSNDKKLLRRFRYRKRPEG